MRILRALPLRVKIVAYLVLVHVILGVIALFALSREPIWLFGVEALFAASILVGVLLVRTFFVPLQMIRTGADLIREEDFTARFREVGQPEMDDLIRIYNRMIDRLREERLKLLEQHTFLERVLSASPAGVVTLDFDGKVTLMNPSASRFLGVDAIEATGRGFRELGPDACATLMSMEVGTSDVLSVDGRRLKCSRAEFFDRGFPRSFFVVEELTEELRASEKATYEKIIRVLSHEVNNSVGAVSSLLDSVRAYAPARPDDEKDFRGALDVAVGRLGHLDAFMRGFADVVRLPSPDRRLSDLKRLLEDIVTLFRPETERRRITLRLEVSDSIPTVSMDKNQIEQVLVNVLKNAMESIGEDGRIDLVLSEDRGRPLLTVSDTGGGIADDAREQIFTPFFSTKREGRGLGLTVVREILSQHRFDFSLDSRPSGGAEFRIRFAP